MALQEQHELNQQLEQFRLAFDTDDLHGALRYLNARTTFRYTAIYRLDGQMMRNIYLYDRQGENPTSLCEVPLGDSFCQFVMRDNGFNTVNSADDARLLGHPYQGVMNSYFGLPLSRKAGTIFGTLCHFDVEPMMIPDGEISLLEAVSPVLMDQLD
ncbi:guanylate cyclase [Polaromonas sp. DSR2-3-2]|uniref:guanylate cyclase n=1 Tax=unclassified Polaromonas TaxID=2638319 RepID=UPI003CE7D7C4